MEYPTPPSREEDIGQIPASMTHILYLLVIISGYLGVKKVF